MWDIAGYEVNISLILAVLGAVLGVYNTWRIHVRDRIRVVLRRRNKGLEIYNASSFEVTVVEAGYQFEDGSTDLQVVDSDLQRVSAVRIPPRHVVSLQATLRGAIRNAIEGPNKHYAFIRTADDAIHYEQGANKWQMRWRRMRYKAPSE